jgi:hypothetical protein
MYRMSSLLASLEGAKGLQGDLRQEGGLGAGEEQVEVPAHAVVVEEGRLFRRQVKEFRDEALQPLGDGIQGLPRQEDVAEQDQQDGGRWQGGVPPGARRWRRQVALQDLTRLQALEEGVEDGHGADLQGVQRGLAQVEHEAASQGRAWRPCQV